MVFKTLFASLVLASTAVYALPSLSVSLSGPSNVAGVDNFKVEAIITNTGKETVKLLDDPRTLASDTPVNKFSIVHANGGNPSFTGMLVKYSPEIAAKEGEYKVLAPGESTKVVHNLFEAYDFTGPGVGTYKLVPDTSFYVVDEQGEIGVVHADITEPYTAQVDGPTLAVARADGPSARGLTRRAPYVGCSATRQAIIVKAAAAAEVYARNARTYLTTHTTSTPRFTTWFGVFAAARRAIVLDHFTKIDSNTFSSFTYDCTCTRPSTFAFVYPSTFGTIYFCEAFWRANLTGTDSMAGTIIHESSHFNVNGGTRDHAYGQSAARALAISNPNTAVLNADSHEYFAENTPVQV